MKKKTIVNLFVAVLTFMFIICYITVPSNAKFIRELNAPFGEDTTLDYTVNNVLEVKSQEELFAAINNGYSFIQINKDVENPLIVTQKAENLNSDLILDLNGIEIQRNGPDPILNISPGVRLTIMDTSEEKTGGLYNPVGSVFNINGGILTVANGIFESGPRYSEYYSYNSKILDNTATSTTKRTLVEQNLQKATYYDNVFDSNGNLSSTTKTTNASMPIIRSYPVETGEITYTHGNLYFDEEVQVGGFTISADSYFYYQTSEDVASGAVSPATADWYYTYYVRKDNYEYKGENLILNSGESEEDYMLITVYSYENTIKNATEIVNPSDYYAAIQMQSGSLEVKSGGFYSYFGVDKTACVNAVGGNIAVTEGDFSSRIPNATTADQNLIKKKESDKLAFGGVYFDKFIWNNNAFAYSGESYCIRNGGDATVDIGKGNFYSSNNNIVNMSGGTLTVGGGEFTKTNTTALDSAISSAAAVYMADGELSVSNATYKVSGNYNYGVLMQNGTLTFSNVNCNIDGANTYGVYLTQGYLDITGGTFDISGNDSHGVLMQNGTLDVQETAFTITGDRSYGINMTSGKITVSKSSCEVEGSNTYGIYSTVNGNDNFTVTDTSFSLTEGDNQTGIYTENGTVTLSSTSSHKISVTGANSSGIFANNGSVISSNYSYELTNADSIGIRAVNGKVTVAGGDITLDGARSYGVQSEGGEVTVDGGNITLSGNSSYGVQSEGGTVTVTGGDITLNGTNSYGVYSQGGTILATGGNITLISNQSCYGVFAQSTTQEINITLDGVNIDVGYESTAFRSGTVDSSIGVYMSTSNSESKVQLTNSNISCYEMGIALLGGQLSFLDSDTMDNSILTKKASAIAVFGGNLTFDSSSNYNIESANTTTTNYQNSYNLNLPNGTNYRNTDGIYVSGGTFTSNGNVNITHTGLQNETDLKDEYGNDKTYYFNSLVVTSYAVRVEGGSVTITKANITANAGGGIYCSKGSSEKSEIIMGSSSMNASDITVTTTGEEQGDVYYAIGKVNGSWESKKSITGGHAIELNGGDITVYGGKYEAYFGNGVAATGNGTIDVYNGEFYGWMGKTDGKVISGKTGPSAFYGLKITGGATVNLYSGTFNGGNGGAFVTGLDYFEVDSEGEHVLYDKNKYKSKEDFAQNAPRAQLYVYSGVFGDEKNTTVGDAFNIYDYSTVVFGAYRSSNDTSEDASTSIITPSSWTQADYLNAITMYGKWSSIASNSLASKDGDEFISDIFAYYGTYDSKGSGVWNANANLYLYNTELNYTTWAPHSVMAPYLDLYKYHIIDNTTPIYYPNTITN